MIELLWKYSQLVTLRVAPFFFHDNASPAGMRDRSKVKKTVPAQGTLATSCGAGLKPLRGARKLMNFSPPQLPYGKFCHRADAVNATAQKIALRANGNPQKSINFVHWSSSDGIKWNNSQIANTAHSTIFFNYDASPSGFWV